MTLHVRADVPNLRTDKIFFQIQRAFHESLGRFGMRLIDFSIQHNHIHFIVEADNQQALSKGMQGLLIRIARGINRACKRKGSVFDDRYHEHVLRTPTEVRNAVRYVRYNFNKHIGEKRPFVDEYSSMCGAATWWEDEKGSMYVIAKPQTWLLNQGLSLRRQHPR